MGASAVRKREKWKWLLPSSAQTTTSGTHEETFRADDIRLSPCYSSSTARPPRWNRSSFTCLLALAFLLQSVSALPPVIRIGTKRNWIIKTQLQLHLFSTSFFIKKVVHKKENWMFRIDFTLYTLSGRTFFRLQRFISNAGANHDDSASMNWFNFTTPFFIKELFTLSNCRYCSSIPFIYIYIFFVLFFLETVKGCSTGCILWFSKTSAFLLCVNSSTGRLSFICKGFVLIRLYRFIILIGTRY